MSKKLEKKYKINTLTSHAGLNPEENFGIMESSKLRQNLVPNIGSCR